MNASYFVVYNRKGKLNKQGKALIQMRVYFDRISSKFISTEIYVAPEHWNERKKLVDESHPAHYNLNKRIKMLVSEIEAFEYEQEKYNGPFNKEILEGFLKGKFLREEFTFNRFYKQEMEKPVNNEPSTYCTWRQSLNKLNEFRPNVRFKDIGKRFR
jgi:hypothetical protein